MVCPVLMSNRLVADSDPSSVAEFAVSQTAAPGAKSEIVVAGISVDRNTVHAAFSEVSPPVMTLPMTVPRKLNTRILPSDDNFTSTLFGVAGAPAVTLRFDNNGTDRIRIVPSVTDPQKGRASDLGAGHAPSSHLHDHLADDSVRHRCSGGGPDS